MINYHATVHDDKTNEIIFESQVYANTPGEAHEKIANYLIINNRNDLAKLGAVLMEIGARQMVGIPIIK